jgi:hypothetical protein
MLFFIQSVGGRDVGGHDFNVWKNDFYLFAQRIFQ